jgi:hypothetical protein
VGGEGSRWLIVEDGGRGQPGILERVVKQLLLASTLLAPLALSACASGSGNGGGPAPVTPAVIGAFAAATVGATPPTTPATGFQQASAGGPSFTSPSQPPNGTVFALTQSAIVVSRDASNNITGVAADTAVNSGGATATVDTAANYQFELKIPAIGADGVTQANGPAVKLADGTHLYLQTDTTNSGANEFQYLVAGDWTQSDSTNTYTTRLGTFIFGYQTPVGAMPVAGSATYSATDSVFGTVVIPTSQGGAVGSTVSGNVSMTANFATGHVTGAFSNMVANGGGAYGDAWNNVAFTANIAGADFSGSTSVTNTVTSKFGLAATATGTINGGFYGPNASETGAVWTLSDGTNSVVGAFGADIVPGPAVVTAFSPATTATPAPTTPAQGYELASTTSSSFNPAAGTVFALTQSVGQIALGANNAIISAGPDAATQTAGATLTASSASAGAFELKVPNLGIDAVVKPNGSATWLPGGSHVSLATVTNGSGGDLLDYALLGAWSVSAPSSPGAATNFGGFIAGYQTPPAGMPTTGTATYSATNNVLGAVVAPSSGGGGTVASLTGNASITANFATGAVTGSLTNMTASYESVSTAWNSVSLTATIAGNTFSGATAATSAPATTYALAAGATGAVKGGFYGPTANEAAAVWTLSDGTKAAVGVFGSPQTAVPSDRRLKRDIRLVEVRADGLRLYAFRYLGSREVFVGVMGQDLVADPRFAGAVLRRPSGVLIVDYARLGYAPARLPAMRKAGAAAVAAFEARRAAA